MLPAQGTCLPGRGTLFLTWKDLMKVHRRVLTPSPRLSSFTSRITRNSRKKVMETRELSSESCGQSTTPGGQQVLTHPGRQREI